MPTQEDQGSFAFDDAVTALKNHTADSTTITTTLLSNLTLPERLSLLDGDSPFWPGLHALLTTGYNTTPITHGSLPRLGIPGICFADGPRGCVLGHSTAFPAPMTRGATWDTFLETRIGLAIGRECRAQGANFFGGVCVNLPRHPAWGRAQETYGEDPILLGQFGAALTRGVQRNVMACVKHFALNSMENARFRVDVSVEEGTLHEVYLAHFRRILEEGVAAVMSSYNSVRGEYAGQNRELLMDILRGQYGFQGFVMSDFLYGLRDAPLSLKNGLDIEAPFRSLRDLHLKTALDGGVVTAEEVDRACMVILKRQIEDAATRDSPAPSPSVVFCEEHRMLAREAATKAMVLLKNRDVRGKPLLPLHPSPSRIAVIGRLANTSNTGDRGSSNVRCPVVISPFKGLKEALPESEVLLDDTDSAENASKTASAAEAVIVIVGYDWRDEGEFTTPPFKTNPELLDILPPSDGSEEAEAAKSILINDSDPENPPRNDDPDFGIGAGGDRRSLRLRSTDVAIIKAAVSANPRTVICIVAAGAVIMEEWDGLAPAIMYTGYSGCEGGRALADVLLGREDVSGRLPFSIPRDEEHLPFFDRNATEITYDQWFGQRLLDRLGVQAAYPLGWGLSYTRFQLSDLQVRSGDDPETLRVSVRVSNTGGRPGRFTAQVYGTVDVPDRPRRVLLGFGVVHVEQGRDEVVEVAASTRPLQRWNKGTWELAAQHVGVEVGSYSGDPDSLKTGFSFASTSV